MKCPFCGEEVHISKHLHNTLCEHGLEQIFIKQTKEIERLNSVNRDWKVMRDTISDQRIEINRLKRFETAFDNLPEMFNAYGHPIDKEKDILEGLK